MATKYIQLPTCKLAEFAAAATTSFDVSGFIYNDGVTAVDPADIGDVCFATLEPQTAREELISFTIDSVTAAGVATVTAVRGLSQKSPYSTGGAAFDHQNGSDFVISNNPGLFNRLTAKDNAEEVTAQWVFPTPTTAGAPVTKSYAEAQFVYKTGAQSIAGVKTFTSAPVVPTASADGNPIRKDAFDAQAVKLTGAQTVAGIKTFSSSPIVPTATTATQAMNKSQVESYVAANSGDVKASDTAFGTVKLDVAADDPADPKAVTATADRVAALAGGGDLGTPSADNKFTTEESDRILIDGFGDGSDGDIILDGTNTYASIMSLSGSEYTLTSDIKAENLTIESGITLNTDGYIIYVRNTIGGVGTLRHSDPSSGVGGDGTLSGNAGGSGGGSGASSGIVLVYAANWTGTFTIESIGSDGGDGYAGFDAFGANSQGGAAGIQRGSGLLKGAPGKVGAAGSDSLTIPGNSGDSANPCIKAVNGASGGKGGGSDFNIGRGGSGGSGGGAVPASFSLENFRFLASAFMGVNSSGQLERLISMPGSGSGGNGSQDVNDNSFGGGGGGGGGNGGHVCFVYKKKTWTGLSDLIGGTGGVGGNGVGAGSYSGQPGQDGNSGILVEINWNSLI